MLLLVVYFNSSPSKDQEIKKPEPKKSENELQWEDIRNNMSRPLRLCDLDFTDLQPEDDANDLVPGIGGGKIPPPPPMHGPPPPMMMKPIPPPSNLFSIPYFNEKTNGQKTGDINGNSTHSIQKNKKTVRSIDARCTRTNTSTKYSTFHRSYSRSNCFGKKCVKIWSQFRLAKPFGMNCLEQISTPRSWSIYSNRGQKIWWQR